MSHRSITHVGGVLLAVLLSIFVATPSAAIQITAGQAFMGALRGDPLIFANLTGFGGFSLNAEALAHTALASTCIPYTFFGEGRDARCNPGDRVAVAAEWDTRIGFQDTPPQAATLHGVTYQVTRCGPECGPGQLAVSGTFATADFIAPSFLVGDVFTLHEPFTFVGSIVYSRANGTLVTEPLKGKGIVTVKLTKTDEGFQGTETNHETKWLKTDHSYDFIAPSPEPTTLLLWGAGTAGAGLVRWWRRRSRRSVDAR